MSDHVSALGDLYVRVIPLIAEVHRSIQEDACQLVFNIQLIRVVIPVELTLANGEIKPSAVLLADAEISPPETRWRFEGKVLLFSHICKSHVCKHLEESFV